MSEQKWAVLKDEDRIWWLVVQPCDICRYDGILECWDVHSHHRTWEEAMQEANRMAAAHTIVAQAEQIERLQAAVRAADGLVLTFSGLPPRDDLENDYNLLPGDMEAPE